MIIDFFIRNYVAFYNAGLRKGGPKPLSLDFWKQRQQKLQRFSRKENILTPSYRTLGKPGEKLGVKELQGLFDGITLGVWTLDAGSIAVIWDRLLAERPQVIVECGSGVSTIIFAKYFSLYRPDGRLFSMEQDAKEKARIEQRLKELHLTERVHIYHVPVDASGGYDFAAQGGIAAFPGIEKFDWIMVDGPAGPATSRDNTLTSLLPMANSGASWFLDDSFRDGEQAVLQRWSERPEIAVTGIYPIGKGLATGKIK